MSVATLGEEARRTSHCLLVSARRLGRSRDASAAGRPSKPRASAGRLNPSLESGWADKSLTFANSKSLNMLLEFRRRCSGIPTVYVQPAHQSAIR